jgi:hypothetical protein
MIRRNLFPAACSRTFAKLVSPGNDPLVVLRNECFERNLCDDFGFRLPGVHWVFHIAVGGEDTEKVRF